MPKPANNITNKTLENAKPRDKEYSISIGDNLALRIKPNGKKIWVRNFLKPITKQRTSLKLGEYPSLTLMDAKTQNLEISRALKDGIDPISERTRNTKTAIEDKEYTVRVLIDAWIEIKKREISADYAQDVYRSFELHIFPHIENTPINELTSQSLIKILDPIYNSGRKELVKRLLQRINEAMRFAINRERAINNPLAFLIDEYPYKSEDKTPLPTIKKEELAKFLSDIDNTNLEISTRGALHFQLHTMTRAKETANATWSDFNFYKPNLTETDWLEIKDAARSAAETNSASTKSKQPIWEIPKERTKTKKEVHEIPLTIQTINILEVMYKFNGHTKYVFLSPSNKKAESTARPINSQTVNSAIKRNGYSEKLVSHGFRSLASTTLNEEGFNFHAIESALGHKIPDKVRAAYNRSTYFEMRTEIMRWWSNFIDEQKQKKVL